MVTLSTKASGVTSSPNVLAFPGIAPVAATIEVALVTHEGRLVLSGVVLTLFHHVEIGHNLLNLE